MIIYTNLIPKRFDGLAIGFITLIRPSLKEDVGLHAHEEVHRKQFFKNIFFGVKYALSKNFRFKCEVEAYREQLKHSPGKEVVFATYLVNNYGLDVTFTEAIFALTNES